MHRKVREESKGGWCCVNKQRRERRCREGMVVGGGKEDRRLCKGPALCNILRTSCLVVRSHSQ